MDDQEICHSDVQAFSLGAAAVSGNSYMWTSSQGDVTSSLSNPVAFPTSPGTYEYYLVETVDATLCKASDTVIIIVNPNPENDSVYGMPGLHTVKSELKRTSPPAWEVLGEECYEWWSNRRLEFWERQ